jgi:hypothetical protein
VKAVISGSFKRHLTQLATQAAALRFHGVEILSPKSFNVVGEEDGFFFMDSDTSRSAKQVQDGHLAAIKQADFLWIVAPDGYVGLSTALEIGTAVAHKVPVYSLKPITDPTISQYVLVVVDMPSVLRR